MKSKRFLGLLLLFCFFIFGCGSKFEHTEIPVPENTKKNIDKEIPKDFGFFSLKTSYPANLETLHESTLFVSGVIGEVDDLKLQLASIKDNDRVLFKSINRYVINEIVLKGRMSSTNTVSIDIKGKGKISYPLKSEIAAKDAPQETLVEKCIEEMKSDPKGVLLMERRLGKKYQDELLEIVFRVSDESSVYKTSAAERPERIRPAMISFHFISSPDPALDLVQGLIPGTESVPEQVLYYMREAVLSNEDVTGAKANSRVMNGSAVYFVEIKFTSEAAEKLSQITKDNLGRDLAIVVNDKVIASPKILQPILDGKCEIHGRFTKDEAGQMAQMINAGR